MTSANATVSTILASQAAPGQWMVYENARMNQRIVDVSGTRDGQIRIRADYGNGGEPGTLFFESQDKIQVSNSNDA